MFRVDLQFVLGDNTLVTSFTYSDIKKNYFFKMLALKKYLEGFLGGSVVKNPPANAGDTGLIPEPGRSHMPWSN